MIKMNRETVNTLLLYLGIFTFSIVIGSLGSLMIAEFSTERYNFTIDSKVKNISYIYSASFVALFMIVAIPLTLAASCTRHRVEYVRVGIQH